MEVLMGKSSINGQFSMAMLNNQRVTNTDPEFWDPKNHIFKNGCEISLTPF
jgi:hypothetical protein